MTGLISLSSDRIRGMHTKPNRLTLNFPERYTVFYWDKLDKNQLSVLRDMGYKGFISFPRNTWVLEKFISVKDAVRNNIIFNDSSEFSKFNSINRSISNGFFYGLQNNIPAWWSLIPPDQLDIHSNDIFTIVFYARSEHCQEEYYPEYLKLLQSYLDTYQNLRFIILGPEESFYVFYEKVLKHLDESRVDIRRETYAMKAFQELGFGEYHAMKLAGDCIPNTYFEAKWLGIKTRIVNQDSKRISHILIGVDEIDFLFSRPNIRDEIQFLGNNYHLIIQKKFKKELFKLFKHSQTRGLSEENLNLYMDDVLELIKENKD